jgi:hypothetical protein
MRILRHPWTSDLSETLISRIFEQYLRGNHPNVEIRYIGRDFPLFGEEDKTIADKRESLFTGSFTQDPIRFLEIQSDIKALVGVHVTKSYGLLRGKMSMRDLFLSETFRREFSSYQIATRDLETHKFLARFGIDSTYIGCVSFLLSSIDLSNHSSSQELQKLLIDLDDESLHIVIDNIDEKEAYQVERTKIPEIFGEHKKNELIDSLIKLLIESKVVITSNINIALPALSLGKRVVLITDTDLDSIPFSDLLSIVSRNQLTERLGKFSLDDLARSASKSEILKRQVVIADFIENVLRSDEREIMRSLVSDYKNQVLTELTNSLVTKIHHLETVETQFRGVLSSRSWKVTAPLRWLTEARRHFRADKADSESGV